MDEFEKIRAFSEEMSRQTEQAVANEEAEVANPYTKPQEHTASSEGKDNPNFLEEWNTETEVKEPVSKSMSKTFWVVLSLTTLVLIALIVVCWLLLRAPMEKGEVISIAPTPNAVKVKPENPGGVVIPDQDKEIYTRLTQDTVPVRVEKVVETQEETPVFPPLFEEEEVVEEVEAPLEPIKVITEVAEEKEVKPVLTEKVKEVKKPVVKKEATPRKAEPVKKEVAPATEKWRVQLFSSSDKAKVESTWKTISTKHKKLLSNMPMDIEKAEISGKGTFYRLKVGDFTIKERAANLCAKLKKKQQDCLPVK